MSLTRRAAATAFLVLLAAPLLAQSRNPRRPPGQGPREDAFRMVDAYIVSNLQESVGLTDEQFVKVLPLVKRLQGDRRELAEKRRGALRDLRDLMQAGSATEAKVAERLREVKALELEEVDRLRRNLEAVDAVLDPVQQAKFRIMQIEVEQKIRELMQEVRQRRRERP